MWVLCQVFVENFENFKGEEEKGNQKDGWLDIVLTYNIIKVKYC